MRPTRRNRGAAVVLVGFALAASMGLAVVTIDLGHLSTAAGEVQTLADVAATGATRSLMQQSGKGSDPVAAVNAVLASNTVDGASGSEATRDVQVGRYNFAKHSFSAGGGAPNAVRVAVSANVRNIVAGIYGAPEAQVSREAIAAISGNASGHPKLPLAIGVCHFAKYERAGKCSAMPATLKLAPNGKDGTGWTSLGADPASASKALRYLPSECGGGGDEPLRLRVGDAVGVMNGSASSVLKTVQACIAKGHKEFVVPVVNVGCKAKLNKKRPIVGFATVKVAAKKGAKGIDVTPICNANTPGEAPGGPDLGTRSAALVR